MSNQTVLQLVLQSETFLLTSLYGLFEGLYHSLQLGGCGGVPI